MYDELSNARRIGILGGTFNPVHNRHIELARLMCERFRLESVWLMVAKDPPHKRVSVDAQERFLMAKLAARGDYRLHASDIELSREGKSYTFDTLTQLKALMPDAEFYLIIGDDMLLELHTWYRADELLRRCEVIAIPREAGIEAARQKADELMSQMGACVHVPDIPVSHVSSTLIREYVYKALPISDMVPYAVERHIYGAGLYQPEHIRSLIKLCAQALQKSRFEHTMGVVKAAIELAHIHGIDPDKARLAALLHDIGRRDEKGALEHAEAGARIAYSELNIRDEEVLSAIRRHTTLCANAKALDKLIYIADIIEPTRDFEGLDEIRNMASRNLDDAVIMGLERTVSYLNARGIPIAKPTIQAIAYLKNN